MRKFLIGTAAVHTLFAAAVLVHARRRGRPAGRWIVLTLLFGVGGVAGYVLTGR